MFIAIGLLKQYLNEYIGCSRRHDLTYPLSFVFLEEDMPAEREVALQQQQQQHITIATSASKAV